MATRGGSPMPTITASTSGVSLSNFSFSGKRAGASPRGSSDTPSVREITTDGNEKQPWMETATPGKFDLFQAKIFPVIEYLTAKPENTNHAFTKRWMILKRTPNTPMKVDITWRNLKILLGIKTMFEYHDFLTQCPEFSSVIKLQNSRTTKSGFDFGIYSSYTNMLSSFTLPQEQFTSKSSSEDKSYVIEINTNSSEPSLQAESIMTPHEQLTQSGRKSIEVAPISVADPIISDSKDDITNTPRQKQFDS
jgi:hypothetical protein